MNNKTVLLVLVTVLVGVLVIFLSSVSETEPPFVAPENSVSSLSGNAPVTSKSSPPADPPLTQKPVNPVTSTSSQQLPALEPEIREALGSMLSTSSEGLVVETRNGVSSVDLQGRFRTVPVATVDKDGNVQITDYSHLPEASTQP